MDSKKNTFLSQLFSPAMGLAILGTVAFAFSLFRAGQLSHLVIQKDSQPIPVSNNMVQNNAAGAKAKIDINSVALIDAVDSSQAANLARAGQYQQAVDEANKILNSKSPADLSDIILAGDILSQYGDKTHGLDLLAKALTMAPNNQYLTLRYALRLGQNGRYTLAKKQLLPLTKKYPEWKEPHFLLSKIYFKKENPELSIGELNFLAENPDLTSKEAEETGLLLAHLGNFDEGYKVFQQAIAAKNKDRFYTSYCQDYLTKYPNAYENALTEIKSQLTPTTTTTSIPMDGNKETELQIKEAALLLLLNQEKDALIFLKETTAKKPHNLDLQILLATTDLLLGQTNEATAAFQTAAKNYEPQF